MPRMHRKLRAITLATSIASAWAIPCAAQYSALPPSGARVVTERAEHGGIACLINGQRYGPMTYSANDAGKRGVPALPVDQLRMLRIIQHFVPSLHLRFASVHSEFIVFNAMKGPCWAGAPGYQVLTAQSCNEGWSPTDGLGALPDCSNPPRPWVRGDRGMGSPTTWSRGQSY
jgi:hypothetical protein